MHDISELTSKAIKKFQKDPRQSLPLFIKAKKLGEELDLPPGVKDQLEYNVGLTFYSIGEYKKAIESYNRLSTTVYEGHYEKALSFFNLGNFNEGVKHYFNRYLKNTHDAIRFPKLPIPFWEFGNPLDYFTGKRVLVLNEQGLGDELMFARAIREVSAIAAEVHVQVYPENLRLFNEFDFPQNVIFSDERTLSKEFIESFGIYTLIGNLWCQFYDSLPPTFKNVEQKVRSDKIKIGFVSSPNKKSKNSKDRSVDFSFFKQLGKLENVELHSLSISESPNFAISHKDEIADLLDTKRLIDEMDLVITVDTSVAHLAALTNTPMILVYDQYLDWRWKHHFYRNDIKVFSFRRDVKKIITEISIL